jgi:FkbM family methyltransferase
MGWIASLARRLRRVRYGAGRMSTGVGAGLRFDPASSNSDYASGANELPVQAVLARQLKAGDVVYDVGANVGFLSVIAARLVGPQGAVFAFEPLPDNAAMVRRNADANGFRNVQVIEVALADHSGTGDLALASYSGGSALAYAATPPDRAGTLQVELRSIDDLVEREGFKPPSLVKIDVEGAELGVLEGMERTAARHRPVILYEIDDAEPGPLQRKHAACERWLVAHGYRVEVLPDSYPGIRWLVKHYLATPVDAR